MFDNFFNIERIIHSIKTAVACIVGFILAKFIGLSNGLWIVVTIIVVMCAQIYVGSVLWKSYLRFLGTFIGCLFATITLIAVGPTSTAILVTIVLSSFIFSYLATANDNLVYAGTLGAATTAIILLNPNPTINIAAERFLEISTGILVATLISQFVLPIHARTHLKRNQANTLEQLRDYYEGCMMTNQDDIESAHFEEVDENIAKSLSKQRELAKAAGREPFGPLFDPNFFVQLLHLEKEMLRAINFMKIAMNHIENAEVLFRQSSEFKSFNESVMQAFNVLIHAIGTDKVVTMHIHTPSLTSFKEDMQKRLTAESRSDSIYIDGFLFSADTLTTCMIRLANLCNVTLKD